MATLRRLAAIVLAAAMALSLAATPAAADRPGQAELERYARSTWRGFEAMTPASGLTADNTCRGANGAWTSSRYTSPTNIGVYLWSVVAADELDIISKAEATRRIDRTLRSVAALERSNGFYYNWYDPVTGERLETWPVDGNPVKPYLSSVDNGWLAAGLMVVRNARPRFAAQASAILRDMDFGFFYEPYDPAHPFAGTGQLWGGYTTEDNAALGWRKGYDFHYGMFNTEPRIASYIGIALGQIEPQHYFRTWRTLPREWDWQEQYPEGETRTYTAGGVQVPVFEGHYTYRGKHLVPTWGGSMFEALMPNLLVPEADWAPRSWGVNHPLYVEAQIEHGLEEAGYGYWGFSPSNKPEGGYSEYGVDQIGTNPDGYSSNNDKTRVELGYPGTTRVRNIPPQSAYTNGVVTPHASFLALEFKPREALANLRALRADFGAYGEYGFFDAINVDTRVVSPCVLALDQGMVMAAIHNYVEDGEMQRYFTQGAVRRVIKPLIEQELFTAGRVR